MTIDDAIQLLKSNGYRVVKPRAKAAPRPQGLNAIGKPYSPQYDPNYKRRMSLTSITRLLKPMPKHTTWVREEKNEECVVVTDREEFERIVEQATS